MYLNYGGPAFGKQLMRVSEGIVASSRNSFIVVDDNSSMTGSLAVCTSHVGALS